MGLSPTGRFGNTEGRPRTLEDLLASIPQYGYSPPAGAEDLEGILRDRSRMPYGNIGDPSQPAPELTQLGPEAPAIPFVGPQQGPQPPEPVEPERQYGGLTEGLGDMPGPGPHTPPDMQSRLAQVEEGGGGRLAALIAEALMRGGAEASNVQGLTAIMAGQQRQPTDQSAANQLAQMRQLSGEREDQAIASAKNPVTDLVNREYSQNFTTPEQAQQYLQGQKAKADIGNVESTSAARTGTAAAKAQAQEFTAEQAKRFAGGDYSAAPQKIKDEILKEVNVWTKENSGVAKALGAADRIETLLDANNSTGARQAITQMVLLGGETGRLTEGDIGRMARRMGYEGFKDFVKNFVISDLNPEQRAEFLEIASRVRKDANKKLKKTATTTSNRLMKFYPQFKQNDLVEMMIGKEGTDAETVTMVTPDGMIVEDVKAEDVEGLIQNDGWERK